MLVAPTSYTYHRDLRKNYSSEVKLGDALSAGVTTELTPATSLYLHERIDGQNFRGVHCMMKLYLAKKFQLLPTVPPFIPTPMDLQSFCSKGSK